MSENYAEQFIAKGGTKFDLSKCPTEVDIYSGKSSARAAIKDNAKAIQPLAHKLYGEANRSVLIVCKAWIRRVRTGRQRRFCTARRL